jgi:hypothetical protein
MTDDEIRRLIILKSEGPNLDYKAGFAWSKDNRDKKYELVRDLMALANTKDGGRVIFGVRDGDLEFIGVSTEIFESIDPTDVINFRRFMSTIATTRPRTTLRSSIGRRSSLRRIIRYDRDSRALQHRRSVRVSTRIGR